METFSSSGFQVIEQDVELVRSESFATCVDDSLVAGLLDEVLASAKGRTFEA